MEEKTKVASDESYRVRETHDLVFWYQIMGVCVQDPSSLEAKQQQHQAFEAELQANKWRIDSVVEAGQQLTSEQHSASDTIQLVCVGVCVWV